MGLKIPRSKGRAGSIPASGTKQIKGLHEILRAGPLFLLRKNSDRSAILDFRPSSWHLANVRPLGPHPEGIAIID